MQQLSIGNTWTVSLTTMVPSLPWLRWNCSRSLNGKSQMTSELRTKNGSLSSFSKSRANARGPAVHKHMVHNNLLWFLKDELINVELLDTCREPFTLIWICL